MTLEKSSVCNPKHPEPMLASKSRTLERSKREQSGALASAPSPRPQLSLVAWIPDQRLDYRGWVREGRRIGSLARGSAWWLGDWLNYGTEKWGERYAKAAKVTGYDPKTLRNLRYVASRFDPSLRRDNLTWSHHALLAAMETDQQTFWLDRAGRENFSVEDLRTELRYSQKRGGNSEGPDVSGGRVGPPVAPDESDTGSGLLCPKCGFQLEVEGHSDEL